MHGLEVGQCGRGTGGRTDAPLPGKVLDLPAQDRSSLLSTLRAWFDAGGSAVETGKRIYCHPNTVRYRLRRLQEHTGRSLDDPKAVAELLAALDALRLEQGTDRQGQG